jgi:hypothetical protein
MLQSTGQNVLRRLAHGFGQSSSHRFSHRSRQSSLESPGQSSSES